MAGAKSRRTRETPTFFSEEKKVAKKSHLEHICKKSVNLFGRAKSIAGAKSSPPYIRTGPVAQDCSPRLEREIVIERDWWVCKKAHTYSNKYEPEFLLLHSAIICD